LAYGAAEISFGRGAFIAETIPHFLKKIDLDFADFKGRLRAQSLVFGKFVSPMFPLLFHLLPKRTSA
jgi:hypothetical protein